MYGFKGSNNMGTRRHLATNNFNSTNTGIRDLPEFNIVLLGALGVGKSALAVKYITRRFIMEYDPTLEDTYTKVDHIEGQDLTVRIMDTYDTADAEAERYLKWAHGFIIVYSITNRPSFDTAKDLLESVTQYQKLTGKDIVITLIGNKMDLERYRTVSKAFGEQLASDYDCCFYESSAAEDYESVEKAFHDTIKAIARTNDTTLPLPSLFISEEKQPSLLGPIPPGQGGRTYLSMRRVKPPKGVDLKDSNKADKDASLKTLPRRATPSFRILKGFKIFQ